MVRPAWRATKKKATRIQMTFSCAAAVLFCVLPFFFRRPGLLPGNGLNAHAHDPGGGEGALGDRKGAGRVVLGGQGLENFDLEGVILHEGGQAGAADAAVARRGLFHADVHCRTEAHPGIALDQVQLAALGGAVDEDAVPVQDEVELQNIGKFARVERHGDDVRFPQHVVHEGLVGDLAILSSHLGLPRIAGSCCFVCIIPCPYFWP